MTSVITHNLSAGKAPSEEAFKEVADWVPHILWTADPDGTVDFANRIYTTYTGVTLDVGGQGWIKALHPDDVERCLQTWARSIASGIPYAIDFRLIHTDSGEYRWMAVRANPVKDCAGHIVKWYGICTDIHEQKAADEKLAHLAKRLDSTLDSMSDSFLMLDRDWRVTYLNRAAKVLLSAENMDVVGRILWDCFPALVGSEGHKIFLRATADRVPSETEFFSPFLKRWIEIKCYPDEDGLAVYVSDITERREAEAKIAHLAFTDHLTGLPNRQLLQDRLRHAIEMSAVSASLGAVLFLDLDNFKNVNDTQGHGQGDKLLRQLAARLKNASQEGATVARLGGDEFVVVLEQLGHDVETVASCADHCALTLLESLTRPYVLDGQTHTVTGSIGVAILDGQSSSEELLKRADMAMYQAKAGGRNGVRFYDPRMQAAINARVEIERGIRSGMLAGEFSLHYQTQFDNDSRIVGIEGLLRWKSEVFGNVSPVSFIAVAEEAGIIVDLGAFVLEQACLQLVEWSKQTKYEAVPLSINLSASQFRRPDFVSSVKTILDKTKAPANLLVLELTETVLLNDTYEAAKKMEELRALGICFALDDFGTGYSSLSYLRDLPLEQLKIDRSFVSRSPGSSKDLSVLKSIIALGKTLGMSVLAEGVETVEQRTLLAGLGCDAYQGYLFSYPVPARSL